MAYFLCIIPALALLAWSKARNHMQLFWPLGSVILFVAIALPASGSLVPRVPVTIASAIQELRAMQWIRSFMVTLAAIAALVAAGVLYAKYQLPGFWR